MNDYLFNEWLILEIRASYTEVQYVHPFHDCVVERIQKPRGVGNLETNLKCKFLMEDKAKLGCKRRVNRRTNKLG